MPAAKTGPAETRWGKWGRGEGRVQFCHGRRDPHCLEQTMAGCPSLAALDSHCRGWCGQAGRGRESASQLLQPPACLFVSVPPGISSLGLPRRSAQPHFIPASEQVAEVVPSAHPPISQGD